MSTATDETGIYTLAKDALNSTDGDEALAFQQWKAWVVDNPTLLERVLQRAWRDFSRQLSRDQRRRAIGLPHEKDGSSQPPRLPSRQKSSPFGLATVAEASAESIYDRHVPVVKIPLRHARRSHLVEAEEFLIKQINSMTWECIFIRELKAGLKSETETIPDRFSESDIELMIERAHAAVYRRKAEQAAD